MRQSVISHARRIREACPEQYTQSDTEPCSCMRVWEVDGIGVVKGDESAEILRT